MTGPTALAFEEQRYSLPLLDSLTGRLAAALADRGVRAGDRVALMSSNRPEFIVAMRAIWRLGAAVVLLSTAWRRAEVDHALALTRPSHAVGDIPCWPGDADARPRRTGHAPASGSSTAEPRRRRAVRVQLGHHGHAQGRPAHPRAFAAAVAHWRAALGSRRRPDADHDAAVAHPRPAQHRDGASTRAPGSGCTAGSTSTRCCATSRLTGSRSRWRWRPIALALAAHPDLEGYDLSSLRYVMWGATPVTPERRRGRHPARPGSAGCPPTAPASCRSSPATRSTGARLDTVGRAGAAVSSIRVVSLETGEPVGPRRDRRDPGAVGRR